MSKAKVMKPQNGKVTISNDKKSKIINKTNMKAKSSPKKNGPQNGNQKVLKKNIDKAAVKNKNVVNPVVKKVTQVVDNNKNDKKPIVNGKKHVNKPVINAIKPAVKQTSTKKQNIKHVSLQNKVHPKKVSNTERKKNKNARKSKEMFEELLLKGNFKWQKSLETAFRDEDALPFADVMRKIFLFDVEDPNFVKNFIRKVLNFQLKSSGSVFKIEGDIIKRTSELAKKQDTKTKKNSSIEINKEDDTSEEEHESSSDMSEDESTSEME